MGKKKEIRRIFRNLVFSRDGYSCVMCAKKGLDRQDENMHLKHHQNPIVVLDAHHITNRNLMPNGGYVLENGISLCEQCHIKAENEEKGYTQEILYQKINSSFKEAERKSKNL